MICKVYGLPNLYCSVCWAPITFSAKESEYEGDEERYKLIIEGPNGRDICRHIPNGRVLKAGFLDKHIIEIEY